MTKQILFNSARTFALFFGSIVFMLTSCSDYDDDIKNLQGQITANEKAINDLKALVGDGNWITDVEKTASGLKFTMNNGDPIILDGFDGGQQVAIDADGYWTIDGERTDPPVKAQGPQGEVGPQGPQGEDGNPGDSSGPDVNKATHVHNGTWHVWDIGQKKFVDTGIDASPSYVTVDDNGQISVRYADENGNYQTIILPTTSGSAVTSITYIPGLYVNGVEMEKFTVVTENGGAGKFTGLSSVEKVNYHVNPINVNIHNFDWSYLANTATVTTRSAYPTDLLYISGKSYAEGVATINSRMNYAASMKDIATETEDIFALASNDGTSQVVSRYVVAEPRYRITYAQVAIGNKPEYLVDVAVPTSENLETYDYYKGMGASFDAPAKVTDYPATANNPQITFEYDGELDLNSVVMASGNIHTVDLADGLGDRRLFEDLNIEGHSYAFSLPPSFLGDDALKTNQQQFVTLNEATGVIKVGSEYTTSAIDRTPLVQVDLMSDGIFGAKEVVATRYIFLKIVKQNAKELIVNLPLETINYVDLFGKTTPPIAAKTLTMTWEDMNSKIYDALGMNHDEFVEVYGIAGGFPTATSSDASEDRFIGTVVAVDGTSAKDTYEYNVPINTGNHAILDINTGIQWRDEVYVWTVTISPKASHASTNLPVKIVHTFKITPPAMETTFHPIYVSDQGIQETKGRVLIDGSSAGKYEMSLDLAEAFLQKLADPKHEDKYLQYAGLNNNANGVKYHFDFQVANQEGAVVVDPSYVMNAELGEGTTDFPYYRNTEKLVLNVPLKTDPLNFPVQFTEQYPNGQDLDVNWTVRFINPLEITIPKLEIETKDNKTYLDVDVLVVVKFNGTVIYENGEAVVEVGANNRGNLCDFYGVQLPLSYRLDQTNLVNQGSTLSIDGDGVVSWNNAGSDPIDNFKGADIKITTIAEYGTAVPGAIADPESGTTAKTYAVASGSNDLMILKK